ncbi:ABC transporter substrate-binding protein [Minwuia thermotolerans]|uniref:ABC transporter substrate-binding protein n=1 Tax=Minwuia thermotolerans TaxID=2056226 RepID=UPI000D6DC3E9|nr:ABC transporter substrate-binding protein [Minwuia thermotolerans]
MRRGYLASGFLALALAAGFGGAAAAQDTIKLGFIAERAGGYAAYGIPNYNGSRLAIKKINEAGGVTVDGKQYDLELVVRDSRTDERQASAAAVELISDVGVNFLFGAIGRLAPVVLQLSEANGVIYFTSSSSAAAQIDQTKHMVITIPPVPVRVGLTAKGARQIFPDAKSVAFLLRQEATTEELLEPMQEGFKAQGFEIAAVEVYPEGATDLSASLTRIRATKPDLLFTGWDIEPVVLAARTNEEIDAAPRLFSYAVSCRNVQKAGFTRPFAANILAGANLDNPSTPEARQLAEEYKAFVGEKDPDNLYAVMWNYDFYFLLAAAIEKAGTFTDTDKVIKAMQQIEYQGVAGPIGIDEKNRAYYGLDFCYVADSKANPEIIHINP